MRVIMIGTGGMARRHLEVLAAEPGVIIVGQVGRRLEPAQRQALEWGGTPATDLRALLDRIRVDAAWICVPPSMHGAMELALIERSVPFFVEKPLDADCETAEAIAAALQRHAVVSGVGYHWRALDTVPGVQTALTGRPPRLAEGIWFTTTPSPAWWSTRAGGGQMVEQMTHLIDLARFLMGEAEVVASVTHAGGADVPRAGIALLRFGAGAIAAFAASHVLDRSTDVHLALVCDGLMITIRQDSVLYDDGREQHEVPAVADPIQTEDRAFLEAVRTHDVSRLFCTYLDALKSHRLACRIRAMSETAEQ